MPRNASPAAKAAMFSREYAGAAVMLLTVAHDNLGTPVRLARSPEDVTSRGDLYTAFPFDVTLPADEEGRIGGAVLVADNVERALLAALGQINSPPEVTLEVVLSESPDVVEAAFTFTWRSTQFSPTQIRADLQFDDLLNQRFPADDFTPSNHPGLF